MSRLPIYLLFCFLSLLSGIQTDDLQILMKLKSTFLQTSNTSAFSSWESSNSMCNFTGITCNSDNFVTEIELSNHSLTGVLPLDSICLLQSLEKLSFGFNNLNCPIMGELKNCVSLQYLDLGNNFFMGCSVPDISSLSQLQFLYLNGSKFSGTFPYKSLQNMIGLAHLSLGDNLFNPLPFPKEVLKLTNLTLLYLYNCSIQGTIPAEIGNLKELIYLELSYNNMTGKIPIEIGNLVNLRELELYDNSFTGKLPVGLRNLTKLEVFDASVNYLEGDLSELRFLNNLASLALFENNFSGQVPSEFGKFEKLVNLSLYRNSFTGALPQELGSLAKFDFFDASENFFIGPIPPNMCKQGTMRLLLMLQNNLTGEIPASYANCSTLRRFRVSNNLLSGSVPAGIWGLPNVNIIDIALNRINGPITSDIKNAKFLWQLFAANNRLSGELPAEISEGLISINLNDNQLSGSIPQLPTSLSSFQISNNRLTGEIPHSICNVSSLQLLDISNNSLSGKIPKCLGNFCDNLLVMNLQMNNFHGTIPDTFANCYQLRTLVFNGNQLEGLLPKSLVNCKNLEVLDLGNNKINDRFPYWLEALPNLHVLVLKSNRFYGPIRNHNTSGIFFPKLRILDLSHNEFSGLLPRYYFENLNAMMINEDSKHEPQYLGELNYYQDSVVLTVKGLEIKLQRILTIFTTIDFSSNKFEREIPKELGRLIILRLLNLSHNSLTNHIPSSLENLSQLESLDLSCNKLTGQIPIQLTSLTFLAKLNLSQNKLTGPIPQGKQFDTFENNSYYDNLGLCGLPLQIKCSTNDLLPPPLPLIFKEDNDSMFASGFSWKVVLMGYGCGFLVGLAMGCVVFKRGTPQWLLRFVEGDRNGKMRRHNNPRSRKRRN